MSLEKIKNFVVDKIVPHFPSITMIKHRKEFSFKYKFNEPGQLLCAIGRENENLSFFSSLVEEGDIVIDIGANIGIYSLQAYSVNSKGKIIAVEPDPYNIELLKENIRINEFDIEIVDKAITDRSKNITMYRRRSDSGRSSIFRPEVTGESNFSVESLSLDGLIDELELKSVDLIKIDVEGAEDLIISGGKHTLEKRKIKIFMEIHSDRADVKFIEDSMTRYGFRKKIIAQEGKRVFALFLKP